MSNASIEAPSSIFRILQVSAVIVCVLMLVAVFHPETRSKLRSALLQDYRTVVSTAHGRFDRDGVDYTVAKIKTRDSLSIEVYKNLGDGTEVLIEKIPLSDQKDGYFKFNGRATNLAIDDIDGDGISEILAPSFDANLVGRLSIFRYQPETGNFEKVTR